MTSQCETDAGNTRVLLVDDHRVVLAGLRHVINNESDLEVCGEAEDRIGALKTTADTEPDIAVVDLTLKDSNGLELVNELKTLHPQLLVLVLSMHDEELFAERAFQAGANGYIMKEEGPEEFLVAMRQVLNGQVYASEAVKAKAFRQFSKCEKRAAHSDVDSLSNRELAVYRLIGQGFPTRQIAEKLFLSTKTIETYRDRIKQKLGIANATELLQKAIEWSRSQDVA